MDLTLGIDLGTTHIKVATFKLNGSLHSLRTENTPTINLSDGRAVYDPETLWQVVATLLQKTVNSLEPAGKIVSLAVTSMAEAGLLLDDQKRALTPILSWHDVRGKDEAKEWFTRVKPHEFFDITGLNPNHIYSVFKIAWFQKNEPDLFAQARFWLCLPDYVNYRLTKVMATDYSIASRTGLFDLYTKTWSEKILAELDLKKDLLPTLLPSGSVLGTIDPEVSRQTGLEPDLLVSLGGHDHVCGAFAARVVEPRVLLDSMGTSESFISILPSVENLNFAAYQGFNVGHHVVPNLYYLQGGASSNGASVEWFLDNFYRRRGISDPYSELIKQGEQSKIGANGLVFIPHLRGAGPPNRNPLNRGSFLGIRDYHTPSDFTRSVLEGVAFEGQRVLEGMEDVLDSKFQLVKTIGGGTKNTLWMDIKNNLIRGTVEIPTVQESTLLGAALLGGIGAEVYRDHGEALAKTDHLCNVLEENPRNVSEYRSLYDYYLRLLPHLKEINEIIGSSL